MTMRTAPTGRVEGLDAYAPAPIAGVDLDLRDNVNLWGPPPSLARVLRGAGPGLLRYPEPGAESLAGALAHALGVTRDEVVLGCGSDDVIDSFLRAVTAPGDLVAHPEPTFGMLTTFARLNGLRTIGVPLLADGSADIEGLLATGARVTYLASPNNPTGTVTREGAVRRLLDRAAGAILVDEAYAEFADGDDWRRGAPARGNVLVTRTFSKAWGLAGLRVGYGVGAAPLCAAVATARGPYKVNALASGAATAALLEDEEWMRRTARAATDARARLAAALAGRRGVRTWDSRGNFVFAALPGPAGAASAVAARFAERGIGVRAFSGLAGIGDAIRIGVAPEPALSRVIAAVGEVLA